MIRLKDLEDKFFVMKQYTRNHLGTLYKLYDITICSGKVQNHRFLDIIALDSKKGIVYHDGSAYKDIDLLFKDIYEYADSLPFHSDYYDPDYRVGIKEMYCMRDYMESLGFERVRNGSKWGTDRYVIKGANPLFGGTYIDITISFDDDKTSGKIIQESGRSGDYRWLEETFDDFDEAVSKINTIINAQLLTSCVLNMERLDRLSDIRGNLTGSINKFDTDTFETYSSSSKELLIQKLEEALNTLKSL